MARSDLEELFALELEERRVNDYHREYRFAPGRMFRFDFAWPHYEVAVEIQGATFTRGKHTRGLGYRSDCQKNNLAIELGWVVLKGDSEMVRDCSLVESLIKVLKLRGYNE